MTDSILSKAATMEIPINSNGDTRTAEDDSLEQVYIHCPSNLLLISGPLLSYAVNQT